MSEVIRISESTYKRLEALARGFDTPGNVIDRLLDYYMQNHKNTVRGKEEKVHKSRFSILPPINPKMSIIKRVRLPRGAKTTSKAFYRPILKALIDLGGKSNAHEVLIRVEEEMKGILNEVDYQSLPANPNEHRWVNTAKWARKDMTMMKPPLLKPNSAKKIWEITETGRKFLSE